MSSLIGLSGYGRSGKDSTAAVLIELGYERRAFADEVRKALYVLDPVVSSDPRGEEIRLRSLVDRVGWEKAKARPNVRRLMQTMGTELARETWSQDFWVDLLLRGYGGERWVISDVRFPNEADAIKARGGQVWRVDRPGFGPVNDHGSETALDDYDGFDLHIVNGGSLADLADTVRGALVPLPGVPTCELCGRRRTVADPRHHMDAYDYSLLQAINGQRLGWYSADDGEICPECMEVTVRPQR